MRSLLIVSALILATPALAADARADSESCARHPETPSGERVRVDVDGAPSRGPADAKVTVVVFSDFQCPYCLRGAATVKQLIARYGDRIRVVFKNQPLPRHEKAPLAAAAALAANAQGQFWAFHDWLFSVDAVISEDALVSEAGKLGMDAERFRNDLDSGRFAAQVSADQEQARRLGVVGTPTYFINGIRVVGAQPLEALAKIVDQELGR